MTELEVDKAQLDWAVSFTHRAVILWYFIVGIVCLFAPDWWFGPTWWTFQSIPHGGHGLGIVSIALGELTIYSLIVRSRRLLMAAMGMGGVSFYVGAWLIVLQGLIVRTGLMEALFMMYVGCDLLLKGAMLVGKRDGK